jgi:hypothetical protein
MSTAASSSAASSLPAHRGKRARADTEGHSFNQHDTASSPSSINSDLRRRITTHCNAYRSLLLSRDRLTAIVEKLRQHQSNGTVPKSMKVSMQGHEANINAHAALSKKFEQESLSLLIAARETEHGNTQANITAFVTQQTTSLRAHYETLRKEPQNAQSTSFNDEAIAAFTDSLRAALDNVNSEHEAQRTKKIQEKENAHNAMKDTEEKHAPNTEQNVNAIIEAGFAKIMERMVRYVDSKLPSSAASPQHRPKNQQKPGQQQAQTRAPNHQQAGRSDSSSPRQGRDHHRHNHSRPSSRSRSNQHSAAHRRRSGPPGGASPVRDDVNPKAGPRMKISSANSGGKHRSRSRRK